MKFNTSTNKTLLESSLVNNTSHIDKLNSLISDTVHKSYGMNKKFQRDSMGFRMHKITWTPNMLYDNNITTPIKILHNSHIRIDIMDKVVVNEYKKYMNMYGLGLLSNDILLENKDDIFDIYPLIFIDGNFVYKFNINVDNDRVIIFLDIATTVMTDSHTFEIILVNNHDKLIEKFNANNIYYYNERRIYNIQNNTNFKQGSSFLFIGNNNITKCESSECILNWIEFNNIEDNLYNYIDDVDLSKLRNLITKNGHATSYVINIKHLFKSNNMKSNMNKTKYFDIIDTDYAVSEYKLLPIIQRNKPSIDDDYTLISNYNNIFRIEPSGLISDIQDIYLYYYIEYTDNEKFINKYRYIIEYLKQKYDYTSIIDILIDIDDGELHIDAYDMNILNEALSYDDDLDFSIENYKRTDFYTMGAHIDYRFYKIYDTIHKEPELLRNYIKATNTVPTSSLIYMSDVYPDILNITRHSDGDELTSTTKQNIEVFNTPRCLFKISNPTGSLLNMRVYIDGILYTNIHNVLDIHLEIEYFYIELSKLKYETIIEIELFKAFKLNKVIGVNEINSPIDFDISNELNDNHPTMFDIYFTNMDYATLSKNSFLFNRFIGDNMYIIANLNLVCVNEYSIKYAEMKLIDYSNHKQIDVVDNTVLQYKPISITSPEILGPFLPIQTNYQFIDDNGEFSDDLIFIDENGLEISVNALSFLDENGDDLTQIVKYAYLDKFRLNLVNQLYNNTSVVMHVSKMPYGIIYTVSKAGPLDLFIPMSNQLDFNKTRRYIRVYLNGRLLPDIAWVFELNSVFITIKIKKIVNSGDVIVVDITPYAQDIECVKRELADDYILDLTGIITRPLDLDYQDIYLNGRRLNKTNIIEISPTKLGIVNVKSNKNIVIYRKDRDVEYFKFMYSHYNYKYANDNFLSLTGLTAIDKLLFLNIIYNANKKISTIDNSNIEDDIFANVLIDDVGYELYRFYFDVLCELICVRPDFIQLEYVEMIEHFPTVANNYMSTVNGIKCVKINPDVNLGNTNVIKISNSDNINV